MGKTRKSTVSLLMSILEVAVGILLLINPVGFTTGIIVTIGLVLLILGVAHVVGYFRTEPEEAAKKGGLSKGILLLLGGLFCVIKPTWFLTVFPLFTVFYGVLMLVTGVSRVQWTVDMLRRKQKYWFLALIGAVLALLFAVLILTNPFATTAILWNFIGVSLIVEAVADVFVFIFGDKK